MPNLKTKVYPNFYESIKEAKMRLNNTVVLYDGDPYYVLGIVEDPSDSIFRMYLEPLTRASGHMYSFNSFNACPSNLGDIDYDEDDEPPQPTPKNMKEAMDQWLEEHGKPQFGVIRKMMNSPLFNRFRPFPLGMGNYSGNAIYMVRNPTRYTLQGLSESMLYSEVVMLDDPKKGRYSSSPSGNPKRISVGLFNSTTYDIIKGIYPNPKESLDLLNSKDCGNKSVAVHRDFAFVKGPVGTLFLAYKTDVIGFLPHPDTVNIAPRFKYCQEVVEEFNFFSKINML